MWRCFGLFAAATVVSGDMDLLPRAEAATVDAPASSAGLMNDGLRSVYPAASDWDIGGQFRVRYEARNDAGSFPNRDFLKGLDNSNDYYLFRTKVHLGWTPSSWVSGFVEGRDAHAANDSRPVPENDTFDLHQTYLRLGDMKQFPLSFKVGRQEMSYGDERWIGVSDWSNLGRSFDAAKLRFENNVFWLDGFAGRQVLPRDEYFNVVNDYDWFSGLYGSTAKLAAWQQTDFYFLSRNVGTGSPSAVSPTMGGPGPRDIYTFGTRWKSSPGALGNWDYTFEAAGQLGSINQNNVRREQRAYMASGTAGYTWSKTFGSPRLAIGYDFGSGDSNPNDDKNGTLELLFGTNHRLYGLMDVMGLRNMHIPRIGGSIKPIKDVTLSIEWLGFWIAEKGDFLYPESGAGRNQNGYGRNPGFHSYVGNEIDILANWRVAPWGQMQGGYGHFFAGDYIRQSAANGGRSSEDADWFYAQFSFSF